MDNSIAAIAAAPAALSSALGVGVPAFVLVDPMVGEPLPLELADDFDPVGLQRARESAWQRPVYGVALPSAIDLPGQLHPYLVALQGRDEPWLPQTLDMAVVERQQSMEGGLEGTGMAAFRIGAWLTSSAHPDELASSLAKMMLVPPGAPMRARYLRLADRRVVEWMRIVSGSPRFERALGPVREWIYLNALGDLDIVRHVSQPPQSMHLARPEWNELMLGSMIHQTIARWSGSPAASRAAASIGGVPALYRRARAAVAEAQAAAKRWPTRFPQPHDLAAWAALAMCYPNLGQRAEVSTLLDRSGEPVTEALNELCGTIDRLCRPHHPSPLDVVST
jgi:hypothetical protein